jgi:hypothetical protein
MAEPFAVAGGDLKYADTWSPLDGGAIVSITDCTWRPGANGASSSAHVHSMPLSLMGQRW